jgi:hypothetical protein
MDAEWTDCHTSRRPVIRTGTLHIAKALPGAGHLARVIDTLLTVVPVPGHHLQRLPQHWMVWVGYAETYRRIARLRRTCLWTPWRHFIGKKHSVRGFIGRTVTEARVNTQPSEDNLDRDHCKMLF